jgi:lipopolysaccharide/colanic/teichoic acid biosynthesis glycosyltransferase
MEEVLLGASYRIIINVKQLDLSKFRSGGLMEEKIPVRKFDEKLLEELYTKYAAGGLTIARWRLRSRYWFKRISWLLVVEGTRGLKRLIDIIGSAIGLFLLSPILLITALLIKIEDGGPVFFSQPRVGKWGKIFKMYKFRSMVQNADNLKKDLMKYNEAGGTIFKMKRDPRITRVGRVIRKLSIDEMPQLLNVLKGDMSLVGPRPHPVEEVKTYSAADRRRLEVIPGLTGMAQVSGRSSVKFKDTVRLDVQYIESQSIMGDVKILLKTIPAVLSGRGAY